MANDTTITVTGNATAMAIKWAENIESRSTNEQ